MPDATRTYASIAERAYGDSVTTAEALATAIDSLVADPTSAGLSAARSAWLAAREPYLQTEVFRFYGGPIDDPRDGPEGQINAWPLDEAYIDYVEGDPAAGIVNDSEQEISAEALLALNEQGGEKNVATGYHAIEFLLWGQDLSDTGPGARPYTDYAHGGTGEAPARRALYLGTVAGLLVTQLGDVAAAWAPNEDNYRSELEAAAPEEALRRMLTGMIVLSGFETGGERLQAALDTGDQEDEHSCFSDNTHRDMVQDVRGVQNTYRGTYSPISGDTVSGKGVKDVVAALDPELASDLDQKIDASLDLAEALQPPFDREIASGNAEGRARVQALVDSLREQEELLEQVFHAFDLEIPAPE